MSTVVGQTSSAWGFILPSIHLGNLGPQLCSTFTASATNVERNNLARVGIHRNPDPWLVRLLPDEAPHLIGLGFQSSDDHVYWTDGELGIEVVGTGCKAFGHKAQEPREADTHHPADPAERDALT
jgi:hypothetical protein